MKAALAPVAAMNSVGVVLRGAGSKSRVKDSGYREDRRKISLRLLLLVVHPQADDAGQLFL